ncbi:MAG TPA: PadR family transcriptional regulator [Jatrophihabitans sp.]|jgi:DNA-binding PadR family transcriptional regulator
MAKSSLSNPLALAVLSCLLEKPMHPYEISTTLRNRGKENSIKLNYGSLYSVVESLSKHGMITASETVRDGRRPERTVYEITPAGREKHDSWLSELLSTPVRDFTSLEAGLSLMPGLSPDEVSRLLDMRAEKLRISLRSLQATFDVAGERGLPDLFLVEDYYRRAMTQAELDFVVKLAEDIRSGALGGAKVWQRMHELVDSGVSLEEIGKDPVRFLGEEARVMQPPQ